MGLNEELARRRQAQSKGEADAEWRDKYGGNPFEPVTPVGVFRDLIQEALPLIPTWKPAWLVPHPGGFESFQTDPVFFEFLHDGWMGRRKGKREVERQKANLARDGRRVRWWNFSNGGSDRDGGWSYGFGFLDDGRICDVSNNGRPIDLANPPMHLVSMVESALADCIEGKPS